MRTFVIALMLGVLCTGGRSASGPPTFGEAGPGTVKVLFSGNAITKPGYYLLADASLAAAIREDKPGISSQVRFVRIGRSVRGMNMHFMVPIDDLKRGRDFQLSEGDVVWLKIDR